MLKARKLFLSTILTVTCAALATAQPRANSSEAKKIDSLMRLYHQAGQFNGVVLVRERDQVIYRKAFGYANFEWNVPNSPETRFRIGSLTKSFTTILTLQLIEQRKLKLDAKITEYLPNFSAKTGDRITVNQLLTHTSGLPDYNNVPEFFRLVHSGLLTEAEILKKVSEYDLLFEPGTKFGYSNDGYRVLGAIIEKVAGRPYAEVLKERVLDVAGMRNSGYVNRTAIVSERATGYRKPLARLEIAPYYEASPASGMYSTLDDLSRWAQALDGESLLSSKSKALMWSISPYGNAYGWHVSKAADGQGVKIMSEGAVPGFFARFVKLPNNKGTIILLTNIRGSTNFLPQIEEGIANIFLGKTYELPKKSLAEVLYATLQANGISAAVNQYRELKRADRLAFNFAESELHDLGYELLRIKRVADAIEIFKLNIEAYPKSSDAYDSLGEAYANIGDKERTIENYRKSVELNPSNENAIQMLKKLQQ